MIFLTDTAFAIELIALSLGAGLLIWALRNQGKGIVLGKVIGSLVLILSIFMLLCTTYSGLKYWTKGSCEISSDMTMDTHNEMMQKMMPLMMQKMIPQVMEKIMEQMGNMENQQSMKHMQQEEPDKGQSAPQ